MDINKMLHLASQYRQEGRFQEAVGTYKKILELDPYNFHILNYIGNVLQDQRKHDEAIECYQKAIQLNPAFAGSYYHLGTLFEIMGQYDKAIQYYEKAIRYDPHFAGSYNNLGNVYRKLGRVDEAIPHFQKAIEVNPQFWGSYYNLGEVYQSKALDDEAIAFYQKVLQSNPQHIGTMNNMANILVERQQIDDALSYCQRAIHLAPEYGEPHLTKAMILLLMGNFEEGWKEYEWRWKTEDAKQWKRQLSRPVWNGSPLKGKTLFIYTEQGVGDEIMFASCFPDVIPQAEKCIIECDRRLVPLFSRSFLGTELIERIGNDAGIQSEPPLFDMVIAMGSLPLHFRPVLSCFPQIKSYLIPDPEKVDKWHKRVRTLGDGLRVGISWRGGKDPRSRKVRSVFLEQWQEILLLKGITFVNLQYGECKEEMKAVKEELQVIIHDWEDADPLKDLDDFAAQISALDLVISVDNATVHMAGALGVPVWTLLPYSPNWRWMLDREDSPWYPTMRLFRQPSLGDWKTVMIKVGQELQDLQNKKFQPSP
ncbi:MAG: tetratricopeptide repeat-containing glycosyltransferase family protein [Thermodesulfovibrionales bacterium]|nr:tetratricopeptide repeat-containing glycosyltransferase family protein [Thermodesulfovibrionales bacterium]